MSLVRSASTETTIISVTPLVAANMIPVSLPARVTAAAARTSHRAAFRRARASMRTQAPTINTTSPVNTELGGAAMPRAARSGIRHSGHFGSAAKATGARNDTVREAARMAIPSLLLARRGLTVIVRPCQAGGARQDVPHMYGSCQLRCFRIDKMSSCQLGCGAEQIAGSAPARALRRRRFDRLIRCDDSIARNR